MTDKEATPSGSNGTDNDIFKDQRFAHLVADPRFKNIYKSTKSVKIDKRFESMFKDDKFKVKYTIDKYGRRVNKSSTDDLEKYYELSSEDEDEVLKEKQKEEEQITKEGGDVGHLHESDEEIEENIKSKLKDMSVDYARGELPLLRIVHRMMNRRVMKRSVNCISIMFGVNWIMMLHGQKIQHAA